MERTAGDTVHIDAVTRGLRPAIYRQEVAVQTDANMAGKESTADRVSSYIRLSRLIE